MHLPPEPPFNPSQDLYACRDIRGERTLYRRGDKVDWKKDGITPNQIKRLHMARFVSHHNPNITPAERGADRYINPRRYEEKPFTPKAIEEKKPEVKVEHVGGPWYMVGDEKIMGKKKAEARAKELNG